MRKPILVTGSHRSGTTWTGNMLAVAPRTQYVHEPFNINTLPDSDSLFTKWYQYVCKENECHYREALSKLITYDYPLVHNLAKAKTAKDIARTAREQGKLLRCRFRNCTPIVKDPIALFSADWLSTTFDMNVVVMIRHPAAFCSSLKLKNWRYNFSHFLEQPLLMERYLRRFEDDIREYAENEQDIISQAILLWNCIYYTVSIYQNEHPEWLFVKHEALSSHPVNQFRKIYRFLDLEFTSKAKLSILDSSGVHNPTEQQPDSEFVRNSKENILNWRKRLTQNEIKRIEEGTHEVSKLFYTENEWH